MNLMIIIDVNLIHSSELRRYYNCLDKLVVKYDLKLVAGNFMRSEFQPCIEPVIDGIDEPEPQHVVTSVNRANLPDDPYALSKRRKHSDIESFL